MADGGYAVALVALIVGVALATLAIARLIYELRTQGEDHDETLFGDLPKVPEFMHRRRDDE
jgi:hypothetical protein